MQRSGGGAVFGEINVNSRRPLIPDVRAANRRQSHRSTFIRAIRGQTLLRWFRECPTPGIPAAVGAFELCRPEFIRPLFPRIRS